MTGAEIREAFLRYYEEHGHTRVSSSPLVPADDPTLLFTNAGMVQFKGTFLGHEHRNYSRATTSQKCVRAGGKHNDLENVGRTARHHTFFEMLGNFSFGDYFKEGAIDFAWEFLTVRLGLDKSRLWVSVHHSDDEAYAIWRDRIGVSEDRLLRLGDKDNFWSMGDTGPCGPCSEILYDQGEGTGCGRPDCEPGVCDCDRYLEIWNLVFMQFNRDESGTLTPLPRPNIDTGMGLERIAAVMQGVTSNYDTDLFTPLIAFIAEQAGHDYGSDPERDTSVRVIADHARAGVFLVCDGVLPSNEGRGYVLRRILRRAARHGKLLGFENPFLHTVAMQVIEQMGDAYPELLARRDFIDKVLLGEEERFLKTLGKGLTLLDEAMTWLRAAGDTVIPGAEVFKLYDTFGFPADLTADIAEKQGFTLDMEGFEAQMEHQRELARASSSFGTSADASATFGAGEDVTFLGYDTLEAEATVLALQTTKGNAINTLTAGDEGVLLLDRTPFYGESGGQVGDTGSITAPGLRATVTDTQKNEAGIIIHHVRVEKGELATGSACTLTVDAERRKTIMRHHSATHLLQRALQDVLGDHAHQAGSLVTPSRLRFDFTHFQQLTDEELAEVESRINQYVLADLGVSTELLDKDEAVNRGAMALFSEKYGDTVRVVTMGDVSVELCGGTHCGSTGEIGLVKILSESSVSAGLRRIEAVAGMEALNHLRTQEARINEASGALKCSPAELPDRIGGLQAKIKEQDQKIRELNLKLVSGSGSGADEEEIALDNGTKALIKRLSDQEVPQLRELGDQLKNRLGSGVIFLASATRGKATFLIMSTDDVKDRYHAGNLMKQVVGAVGGRGGGKDLFAQGGAGSAEDINKAVETFRAAVKGEA